MKNRYLFLFSFITFVISITKVASQMNMTEPMPDIRIKYEIINETLFCISKYGEGYSENLLSFARENRTIDENFNFDKIYELYLTENDKNLIEKCRRRGYYNTVFPNKRKEGKLSCCQNANTNENNNPKECELQKNDYMKYSLFKKLKIRRRMNSLK